MSSPKALATLEERFQSPVGKRPPKWSLTYPAPRLFRNVDAVEVGFITAAYLMWFRELGYSWALQHHLDVVRRQILTETLTILSRSASVVITSGKRDEPSIGVTHIDGELALVCGIENRLVFFPPADAPELYDRLPSSMNGKSSEIHAFTFSSELRRSLREQGPFGVIFENRVIVWPDVLLKGGYPLLALSREGPPRLLAPISSENFERLKQLYPTQGRTIEPNIRSPERDTGR